jgi:DNA modification methylase
MIAREVLTDVPIEKIKLNIDNPRQNEKAVQEVIKSIQSSDYISPIIVDETDTILAGNTRYKAMVKVGRVVIPIVIKISGMTPDQRTRFILADNKAQEFAEWDWAKLNEYTEAMLKDVGFSKEELDRILENSGEEKDPDKIPEPLPKEYVVRGDLFVLGEHRLLCGDSTSITDLEKLMDGKQASLLFSSPPYWVGKAYETQKSVPEIDKFIHDICVAMVTIVKKDDSRIVINTGTGFTTAFDKKHKRQVMLLIDKWTNNLFALGWNLRHIRHWIKGGQLRSVDLRSDLIDQHSEFIGTFENDEGVDMKFEDKLAEDDINILETFYNRDGISRGSFRTGQKWALKGFWNDIRGNATQTGHVAAFPIELVTRHLLLYTRRDEIIVDIFGGSGSSMVAAEIMLRKCYMMEIAPVYCGIILDRWQEFTGKDPVRAGDNKTWKEIKGG